GPEQVFHQRVDGHLHLAPRAAGAGETHALARLAFLADAPSDALQLLGHAAVGRDDVVEGVGDLAGEPDSIAGQADGEVTVPDRLQGGHELLDVDRVPAFGGRVEPRCGVCRHDPCPRTLAGVLDCDAGQGRPPALVTQSLETK